MLLRSSATISSPEPVINPLMGAQTPRSSPNTAAGALWSRSNIPVYPFKESFLTKKNHVVGFPEPIHAIKHFSASTALRPYLKHIFTFTNSLWLQFACFVSYACIHSETEHHALIYTHIFNFQEADTELSPFCSNKSKA